MQSKKTEHHLFIAMILFIASHLIFSFIQYYHSPLYGDIDGGVLPNEIIEQIFDDPLGWQALKTGEKHVNPNRFFSHFMLSKYFKNVPLWLQTFTDPVSSVYLACALLKIVVQALFIYVIAALISGSNHLFHKKFILSSALIIPLFQVYGYWSRMGIVDKSIAYTFFYALPLVLFMLFFLPFFHNIMNNRKFRTIHYFTLTPLIVILPFSGPLIPAISIIASFLIFINYFFTYKKKGIIPFLKNIPLSFYILLVPLTMMSLYSLFLGTFYDSNYQTDTIPIAERYSRLPYGLFSQLFHSLGFPFLLLIIGINIYFIKKQRSPEGTKLIHCIRWIGIFALIFILLLPLGGYRPYRTRIIRYDTFMPITAALIYYFGLTAYYVLQQLNGKSKKYYTAFLATILLMYSLVDLDGINKNRCERDALQKMAVSNDSIVPIPKDCFVMSWANTFDYKESENRARLIQYWGITHEKKLFYNEELATKEPL
ncbi:MAG: hypothetical protein PHV35_01670 [Mariniphaga sp.]|nr:hypothetical protein [Mariniphaga sp.]MDD4225157.1 hypothetical protein [Mariniphaga sp.]